MLQGLYEALVTNKLIDNFLPKFTRIVNQQFSGSMHSLVTDFMISFKFHTRLI